MTQEQLATEMGISRYTVQVVEKGKRMPNFYLVVKMMKVLDTDLNMFKVYITKEDVK